ncbi:hypothetical protein [Sphingomonas kyungheensis]|uniref:Uncharacterized protein n=1 Tax=Sphingomonas kyungheensis TaxID=1069987 RepID=A0ABU8H879_9SPHN
MQTPWGDLGTLDLDDHEQCRTILASDKHQLAEGLVVESVFDQIFDDVPDHLDGAILLDADTAIVNPGGGGEWLAFVWARAQQPGLGRYLRALEKRFRVWLVETDTPLTTFTAREWKNGKLISGSRPLTILMGELSGRQPQPVEVSQSVRDANRQQQSFWGFLSSQHGPELGRKVILPRLFMNWGVQPWFRAVWNLDRILVHGDDVWLLEIKHKYPMQGPPVSFGLNTGELNVITRLGEAGVRCVHAIVVKPVWSKDAGSMYLLNDMRLRARAALIAVDMNAEVTGSMMAGSRGTSAGHTTFSGSGNLSFRVLKAGAFSRLGLLSDPPAALAENIALLVLGTSLPPVEDRWLTGLAGKTPSSDQLWEAEVPAPASVVADASVPPAAAKFTSAAETPEAKMTTSGHATGHTMAWSVSDRHFQFGAGRGHSSLVLPEGEVIELSNVEWAAVADAIRVLVKKGAKKQSPIRPVSQKEKAPATGERWTEAQETRLLRLWNEENATIGELMKTLDRNEGGIVSRLVKLGAVETRDDVRVESRRREQQVNDKEE